MHRDAVGISGQHLLLSACKKTLSSFTSGLCGRVTIKKRLPLGGGGNLID